MKVNFYATLRQIVGARTAEIPAAPGASARQVLEEILSLYPAMRKELLDEHGNLYGHVHFFINGRDVQFNENAWETKILPGDEVTLFPAVGGG